MARGNSDPSPVSAYDHDFRDDKPLFLAPFRHRKGGPKPEDRAGDSAARHWRMCTWIAIRAQRCCTRLLRFDGVMALAAYRLVRARHGHHLLGRYGIPGAALDLGGSGRNSSACVAGVLRSGSLATIQ